MTKKTQRTINTELNCQLLDKLISDMKLRNDAHLSRVLVVAPPVISKIRHGRLDLGDTLLISAHEVSGLDIADMKKIIGKKSLTRAPA